MGKEKPTSWKAERRKRAWALHQAGWKQKDIAEALGVTKGAVSQWVKRVRDGGEAALADRPRSGAPRRLSTADREKLPDLLAQGAESFGFRGELWTCARVAKVAREFDVQVWAVDLWIPADDNWSRIRAAGLEKQVFPIHAEAHDLPFANDFF